LDKEDEMATATARRPTIDVADSREIRLGSALMLVAAIGFIGYAVALFHP
jgi:hypothetical protein